MNFVPHFNFYGIDGKQIPCITGKGAPTTTTEGAVGCLYMDETYGEVYKLTSEGWKPLVELIPGVDIVQETGDSENVVMSQKAVTEYGKLQGVVNTKTVEFSKIENHRIIGGNGVIEELNGWYYTNLIPLTKGERIYVEVQTPRYLYNAIVSIWSDENTHVRTLLYGDTGTDLTCVYTAEKDCYIRLCGYNGYKMKAKISVINEFNYSIAEEEIKNTARKVSSDFSIVRKFTPHYERVEHCFIDKKGDIYSSVGYYYSHTIELKRGQNVSVVSEMPDSRLYGIVTKWTSDGSFVKTLFNPSATGLHTFEYVVSEETEYIRVCGHTDFTLEVVVKETSEDNLALLKEVLASEFEGAVKYSEQTPTPEQQAQARKNIGIDDVIEEASGVIATKDTVTWLKGYLNASNGEFIAAGTASNFSTTDFIELPKGRYSIETSGVDNKGETINEARSACVYDENQNFVQYLSPLEVIDFTLTSNVNYIRVDVKTKVIDVFLLYDLDFGKETKKVINEDVKIPRLDHKVNTLYEKANGVSGINTGYVRGRRPLIAFIFDGEYDMNATYEALFSQHNARLGFALQYTTSFANNSKNQYLEWERKGHEILVHGNYVLRERLEGDSSTDYYITDVEQGKAYIKDSYVTMKNHGFDAKGYIASGGELDRDAYIPTIKRYFDWASTQYNHSGTSQSHYIYGETKPYELWRYNMQSSTLDQMKQAVDDTISTNSVLVFFGHAKSNESNYLTVENMEALLSYIEEKEISIVRPSEAIKDFFSVRYEELISLLSAQN